MSNLPHFARALRRHKLVVPKDFYLDQIRTLATLLLHIMLWYLVISTYITIASRGRLSLFSTLVLTRPALARWCLIGWVILTGAERQANAAGRVAANVAKAAGFIAHIAMCSRAQWSYPVHPCPAWETTLLILNKVVGMTALLALPRQSEDGTSWLCSRHGGVLWVGFSLWSEADFWLEADFYQYLCRVYSILHVRPLVL
jgi:hypothetical protein